VVAYLVNDVTRASNVLQSTGNKMLSCFSIWQVRNIAFSAYVEMYVAFV